MKRAIFLCCVLLATPVSAQTFSVALGGKVLGEMRYVEQGRGATLLSTLDSTPLGVFNGTFTGTSTGTPTGRFTGESRSSRKQRVVTVDIENGRAMQVAITPADEITELSDVSRVPDGVVDPVRVIGAMVNASGCPASMRMYDGRRVVTLAVGAGSQSGDTLVCPVSYKVVAGPGHLSPLGISSATIEVSYDTVGGGQSLDRITIASGLFRVTLSRVN